VFKVPGLHPQDGREEAPRRQDQGRLLQEDQGRHPTLDPKTLEYRAKGGTRTIKKLCKAVGQDRRPAERVKKLVADQGPAGAFAWKVLAKSLAYSARRIGEISDEVRPSIDAP
jgi:3-hydroxyacyl-CoA dehydrogenase